MEYWKQINGFENYEVSNMGNVRSKDFTFVRSNGRVLNRKGKVLKQTLWKDGYFVVCLQCDGKRVVRKVHRLVYDAFVGINDNTKVVDHIDHDKTNNKLENLQLVTNRYNLSKDSWRTKKENLPVGVSRQSGRNSFVAYIDINGGHYYLGSYNDVESASNAYNTALCNYQEKGILPTNTEIVRHKVIDGYKICSCCGRNLPLSDYYISKGRVQGRCKECFRK